MDYLINISLNIFDSVYLIF